jgi:glycosyltransferase involved in cell wall biosynthesis
MFKKKIGIIATRLGGLDGVALEVDKWVQFLKSRGWKVYLCAGEISSSPYGYSQISGESYAELIKATVIPELAINHRANQRLEKIIFQKQKISPTYLKEKIGKLASKIETDLSRWLRKYQIEKIIVENINALPDHIPAAVAIDALLEKNPSLEALLHHHDFYWERDYYRKINQEAKFYLKKYFPPQRKNVVHLTVNSNAQKELLRRYGLRSIVVPNIFDRFAIKKDEYNQYLRKDIGVEKDDWLFLVPVRIVPRKNIEIAIELVKILKNPKIKLVIAGCVDYRSGNYLKKLKKLSAPIKNQVKFICPYIAPRRHQTNHQRIYTIFDVYAQADFVLYPSLYEGWGNALGEAMISRVPLLVNRYKIFKQDIEKLGFRVVKINRGRLNSRTANQIMEILNNKDLREKMVERNEALIKRYCGFEILERKLKSFLEKRFN